MIKIIAKIFSLLVVCLFLVSQAYAQVDNYDATSYLVLTYKMDSFVETSSLPDPQLEYMIVNLTLVPKNDKSQTVNILEPKASSNSDIDMDETVLYRWNSLEDRYDFSLESQVRTVNYVHEIPHISFPILEVPKEIEKYLSPTENIDINQEIINKATEISAGETDLFEVVFKIADWTKTNIRYDLNTLTATAVQKSSWVLENKEGVCDEMTALFISMLRSVGIPARFVTGMVYTNTLYNFGNHGWAEAYFPDYGWVPFDVTFGEYGYLDPGHIKLSDSTDSASPSVKYSWKEYHVEVKPRELNLNTNVVEHGTDIQPKYKLDIGSLSNNFGEDSYFPIKVTLTNPYDYYVSTTLIVTKAPKLLGSNTKQIFLRPKETKSFYFISYITDDLEQGYIYTSQIEVQDTFGSRASSKVSYSKDFRTLTRQDAQDMISDIIQEPKLYSRDILLSCNLSKPYYYTYETANVYCTIKNTANTVLNNIEVCMLDNCQNFDLGIGSKKDLIIDLPLKDFSPRQLVVNAKNALVQSNYFLTLNVFEKPSIKLEDKIYPLALDYNKDFEFSFVVSSPTKVQNALLKAGSKEFDLGDIYGDKNYTIKLNSKYFTQNFILLKIEFEDENKNTYKYEERLKIEINNTPFYIQFFNFLKSLFT